MQYSIVQCSAVQCSIVQYSTVRYGTVQYSTAQHSTVQHSAVQYRVSGLLGNHAVPPSPVQGRYLEKPLAHLWTRENGDSNNSVGEEVSSDAT